MSVDRVFLDANVLFSAAYRPGAGLALLWHRGAELVTSQYAVAEASLNLPEEQQRDRLRRLLENVLILPGEPRRRSLPDVALPEKDLFILWAAIDAGAAYLLTGDKRHFGPYFGRKLGGVLVLPPSEYLQRRR
jgi:predicted nucleic acid-binding protein